MAGHARTDARCDADPRQPRRIPGARAPRDRPPHRRPAARDVRGVRSVGGLAAAVPAAGRRTSSRSTTSAPIRRARILAGLAAATQRKVQKLVIRRQGHGMALATLEFVELPGANGQVLRVYSTRVDADSQQRIEVARVLLAHSRLGVVMVGELPPHALDSALQPLRDGIARGPWPNRQLLFVPLSAAGALHQHASPTGVAAAVCRCRSTPQAFKPSDAWACDQQHLEPRAWRRHSRDARNGASAGTLQRRCDRPSPLPAPAAGPAAADAAHAADARRRRRPANPTIPGRPTCASASTSPA